jgi:hypothetical protein
MAEIDGIFAFVLATQDNWKVEKEAGVVGVYVTNAVYTILLVGVTDINVNIRRTLVARKNCYLG